MPPPCWVPGCPAGNPDTNDSPVTLFSFPRGKDIREKWLLAIPCIDRSSLDDAKICEKHFTADLILSIQDGDDFDALELAEGAVPSVFDDTPENHARDTSMKEKMAHDELLLPKPCCVFGCDSNAPSRKDAPPIPVFRFPTKRKLTLKWLKVIWRKDWKLSGSSVVCILHFQPDDFIKTQELFLPDGSAAIKPQTIQRLKAAAIPSLFGDPLRTTGLDGAEEVIGGESSSAKRDEDMSSDTDERMPKFLSQYLELNGRVKEENAHDHTLDNRESYSENMMADPTPPIESENYNHTKQSTKASRQSVRKRSNSLKIKQRDEHAAISKRKRKRDKRRITRNIRLGMDYILPDRGLAEPDDSAVHLNGLPAPIVVKTEEPSDVFATVQEIADSWKWSALHTQSVPYVKMHKMIDAGMFINEHDYALTSDKAHLQDAESEQMDDFEEVIIESVIGDKKEETDESLNISDKGNSATVEVDSEIWISTVECDVVHTEVFESNAVESDVVESNVVESNVNGDVADGSDSVNVFLECPARFDGSPVSSVDGFIECVEKHRVANLIRHPEALRDFHILLQDDAAVWWEGYKPTVMSWPQAVMALRSVYETKRSADNVYRCIVKCVRENDESHSSFVDRVLMLFSELPYAVKMFMKIDMIYALLDDDVREAVPRSRLVTKQDLLYSIRSFDDNLKLTGTVIKSNNKETNHASRNFVNIDKCCQCKVMRQKQLELQAQLDSSPMKECITCRKRNFRRTNKTKMPCHNCKKLGYSLVALREEYSLSVKLLKGGKIDTDVRCLACCVLRDESTQTSRNCKLCIRMSADSQVLVEKSNSKKKEKGATKNKVAAVKTKCKDCDKKTIDRHDGKTFLTESCLRCIPFKKVQIKLDRLARAHSKRTKNLNKRNDSVATKDIQMADTNTETRIETSYSTFEDFVSKTTMESSLNVHPAVNSGSETKPRLVAPLPASVPLPGITKKPIQKGVVPKKGIKKGGTLLSNPTKKSLRVTAGMNKTKDSPIDRSQLNLYIQIVMNDSMNITAMLDPLAKGNFLSEKMFEVLVKTDCKFNELPATASVCGGESDVQSVLSTVVSVKIQGKRMETPFLYVKGVDNETRLGEDFIRDTGIVMDRLEEVWYFKIAPHKSYPLEMKP